MDDIRCTRRRPFPGWVTFLGKKFQHERLRMASDASVFAWPSTGGRLELRSPSRFELDYLGIKDYLSECSRCADDVEEDAFALRMRRLGGMFYEHRFSYRRDSQLKRDEIHAWLGWPEDEEHKGRVWVLKVTSYEAAARKTVRIKLASNMQERCRAIEMCGGTFHAHPTDEHLVSIDPEMMPKLREASLVKKVTGLDEETGCSMPAPETDWTASPKEVLEQYDKYVSSLESQVRQGWTIEKS